MMTLLISMSKLTLLQYAVKSSRTEPMITYSGILYGIYISATNCTWHISKEFTGQWIITIHTDTNKRVFEGKVIAIYLRPFNNWTASESAVCPAIE